MNPDSSTPPAGFADDANATFLLRWRGKTEGPYPATVIQARLAANQIGLLHEIFHDGRWLTLRDYLAEREAAIRAARQAQEEQERRTREEGERRAREREEQRHAELLQEERKRTELLQPGAIGRPPSGAFAPGQIVGLKPHRSGMVLTLGLLGFFICGPLSIVAWVMACNDLREMNAGYMDDSGRSTTKIARSLGFWGMLFWMIGFLVVLLI